MLPAPAGCIQACRPAASVRLLPVACTPAQAALTTALPAAPRLPACPQRPARPGGAAGLCPAADAGDWHRELGLWTGGVGSGKSARVVLLSTGSREETPALAACGAGRARTRMAAAGGPPWWARARVRLARGAAPPAGRAVGSGRPLQAALRPAPSLCKLPFDPPPTPPPPAHSHAHAHITTTMLHAAALHTSCPPPPPVLQAALHNQPPPARAASCLAQPATPRAAACRRAASSRSTPPSRRWPARGCRCQRCTTRAR